MDPLTPQDEQTLRAQIARARERREGLVRDLRAIDAELEELATERQQHRLLHEACGALEALSQLGGAGLFWGEVAGGGDDHVRRVRARVEAFQKGVTELEDGRQALMEEIERRQEDVELLEEDLAEARRREEERRLEWLVERAVDALPLRPSVMPWTRGGEDDVRFRKSLAASLLLSLLLALLIPQIDLPLPERREAVQVPERLARLIREARPLPPPPPPREQTVAEQEKPPEEQPLPAAEPTPRPVPRQTPEPGPAVKGILAFRDKFSGLADAVSSARLGAQARIRSPGEVASGQPQRSLVTTQGPGSSGGINLAALSRDVGGGGGQQMEGVRIARATSAIGGAGASQQPLGSGTPALSRTDEEIQIVFDRHKAALYRLYNRELRRDPTLKGQMVLRIRIEPDGSVSLCELQSTDMNAPNLSAQVIDRVRTFDFGAKDDIPAVTILYPIDFLPAT